MRNHTEQALQNARRLRAQMTLPEVKLWRILKQRPLGLKFRRQHPIGRFVADFYCDAPKTIIEIDGIAHDMGDNPQRDIARDAWLRDCGLRVIRIPAKEVLANAEQVATSIATMCTAAPPPSALRAATSPGGEDEGCDSVHPPPSGEVAAEG